MPLSGTRKSFLKAVAQEKRSSFGGWVKKEDIRITLGLSYSAANTLASDLVKFGYLETQGFGNLDIKLSPTGYSCLDTDPEQPTT